MIQLIMKNIFFCFFSLFFLFLCSCRTITISKADKEFDNTDQKTKFVTGEPWKVQRDDGIVVIRESADKTKLKICIEILTINAEEMDFDDITLMVYDSLSQYMKLGKNERMSAPGLVCEKEYSKGSRTFYIFTIPYPQKVKK